MSRSRWSASHEFLGVNTCPAAPRKAGELQFQDIEVVRKNADGSFQPDPIQQQAFAICMDFFDQHLRQ